jgi:hypothetical protein
MQAAGVPPPLPAQILVAVFRRLPDRKPHIVQLDIRVAAMAADIKHEQFHQPYSPRYQVQLYGIR